MIIGIIGGGASGMAAALAASENSNASVLLFERQARLGRKLMATGNGRCNLTNLQASPQRYHGDAPDFAQYALSAFGVDETLAWFEKLGLLTVAEPSGRVYPYSDQANSVLDVLRFSLERPNVQVLTGCEVSKVKKTEQGFSVYTGEDHYLCDKLVIACGGLAGTKLGGSMSGYKLLGKLGHRSTRLRPALVQLKTDWSGVAGLKGVRTNCHAQILCDGTMLSESTAELQFTDYGLSGPVIFEVSRDVCQSKGQWICRLDFLPQLTESELFDKLQARQKTLQNADELFTGILHNRLGRVLTKAAGIGNIPICHMSKAELEAACQAAKAFDVHLTEPMGMDCAQVTAGGVLTSEFYEQTMESRLVPGLYACGEVLDIDGDCGGYNLQWAWSSGRLAGLSSGELNPDRFCAG